MNESRGGSEVQEGVSGEGTWGRVLEEGKEGVSAGESWGRRGPGAEAMWGGPGWVEENDPKCTWRDDIRSDFVGGAKQLCIYSKWMEGHWIILSSGWTWRDLGFIYLFKNFYLSLLTYFWLHWVLFAAHGLSLVVASRGYSLLQCAGFSLRWLLLLLSMGSRLQKLWHTGSVVMAHGLSSCGSRALECRLSSCGARV